MSKIQYCAWCLLSCLVVIADQASKYYASAHLAFGQPFRMFSFLNFRVAHNSGAAFSFLSSASGWQMYLFIIIAVVIAAFLAAWLYRLPSSEKLSAFAIALLLGGAVGNLIDRARFGYVVDFVDFHIHAWHFATFNIADAAITIGVVLLLFRTLFKPA
jgi:signal peptidase II